MVNDAVILFDASSDALVNRCLVGNRAVIASRGASRQRIFNQSVGCNSRVLERWGLSTGRDTKWLATQGFRRIFSSSSELINDVL